MEGDEPGPRVDAKQQRRDVAESDQDLRIAGDGVEIEVREHAAAAPAAADRQDGADRRVAEEAIDVGRAIGILAGQISMAIAKVRTDPRLEADGSERFDRDLQVDGLERRIRRGDQADDVAGRDPARLDRSERLRGGRERRSYQCRCRGAGRRGGEESSAVHACILSEP